MELIKLSNIRTIVFVLFLFTISCGKDSDDANSVNQYNYYYPVDETSITAAQIDNGTGTLDPSAIAVSNGKLYICNASSLEVFDAVSLKYIKTIASYSKGTTNIALSNLTSISIDNNRIYVGSKDSRIFVLDETTNLGISTIGNGQWWNTFVHVFAVVVKDGLVFVKEKETSIKVFETSQITETSDWNLTPIAKLNTLNGWDEIYSMDIEKGNLVVAGRDAKGYLYYDIAAIKANAAASLTTPIVPTSKPFTNAKPIAVSFSKDWAIASESSGSLNFLRFYPKEEFMNKTYSSRINAADIMGENPFGIITGIVQLDDRIFLVDNTNKKIRILKLKKSVISEQK